MGLANGLPRESIGYCTRLGLQILVELNPNILVRDAIIMYTLHSNCTLHIEQGERTGLQGPGGGGQGHGQVLHTAHCTLHTAHCTLQILII